MFDNILSNLFWYSVTIFDNPSLVNFFNALSDIAIENLKVHFKKFPLQLKNLKTNENTPACYTHKAFYWTKFVIAPVKGFRLVREIPKCTSKFSK